MFRTTRKVRDAKFELRCHMYIRHGGCLQQRTMTDQYIELYIPSNGACVSDS